MLNEKLDRLESSTVQSSASMSSIASDVSRVLEILSAAQESSHEPDNATVGDAKPDFEMEAPVLGPIKSTSEDKHDSKHVEWCCDALPGIEAAFETRFDGYGCCYCGSSLGKEEITWHDRGKHLVEVHNFGRCNLLFAYRTADQFMQHMRDCHRMFIRNDNFILQHERITRKLDFQRGLSSNTQALAKTDEYAQTRGLYMAQLKAIIEASKKSNSMSHSIKSHSEIVEGDERLWQLMWDVARLQEEFIVDGHNISSYYSGCETLEHEFWKLDCSELATHSLVQPSLQTWRTDLLSHEPYFPNSYHMRLSVLAIGSASFSPLLSETRPSDGRIRRRHSISEWLYEILSQSWTTRILVREMIGRGTFQLHETLSYWYKDEVIEEPERHCEESNGALDSRDSHKTAWLLPPRDDGKGPHAGEDRSSSDQV